MIYSVSQKKVLSTVIRHQIFIRTKIYTHTHTHTHTLKSECTSVFTDQYESQCMRAVEMMKKLLHCIKILHRGCRESNPAEFTYKIVAVQNHHLDRNARSSCNINGNTLMQVKCKYHSPINFVNSRACLQSKDVHIMTYIHPGFTTYTVTLNKHCLQ